MTPVSTQIVTTGQGYLKLYDNDWHIVIELNISFISLSDSSVHTVVHYQICQHC